MLKAGMIIVERYELLGRIGSGGMADVYKAKDHKLNRCVAVKILKQEFREDTTFITKFKREAQAAAGLAHPNIVNVFDVGEDNGIHFIVMELVEGITLKEYIVKKGRLTVREATSIAIQVSMGLEAAHSHNIVHRDVKPQNIIISTDGKVKVTDFGIARAASSNTISSNVMGSVHYSSPEQVRGGYSDAKSDIYSLGVTIYEMVTGRIPFDGDTTVAIAIKHLQDEMEPPSTYAPELPHSLEQIIYKCTQKSVDRRYNNMSEVIDDLKHSLIEPNGNFVTLVPLSNHAKTVMISKDDLDAIQQGRSQKPVQPQQDYKTIDENAYIRNQKREEEYDDEYDEDEDDDGEINSKLEKALTIGGFIVGAIIICVLIAILGQAAGLFKFSSGKKEKEPQKIEKPVEEVTDDQKITAPDLRGKTQDVATEVTKGLGLGIKVIGEEASADYKKGQIMRQSIEPGTKVAEHTQIQVTISSGTSEEELTIPEINGATQTDAEAKLKDLGLEVSVEKANSESVAIGKVISVTPDVGEVVNAGDTVTLVISTGPKDKKVTVNSVIGLKEEEAKKLLESKGLVVTVTTGESNNVAVGEVMDQSIPNGTTVNAGAEIIITVNSPSQGNNENNNNGSTNNGNTTNNGNSNENTENNQEAQGTWTSNSQLKAAPSNYTGGEIKLELIQTVNGKEVKKVIIEGEKIEFPYELIVVGEPGVTTGKVTMSELVNGSYVSRATYGPVSFSAKKDN